MTETKHSAVERRRIEANVVSLIYHEMIETLGKTKAKDILSSAIIKVSIAEGDTYAQKAKNDRTPENYLNLIQEWSTDGSLDVEPISTTSHQVHFKITRCKYAEMYQEMGLTELGQILSCGRDGNVCSGYNPNIIMERKETIMEGATCCDFRLRLKDKM